MLNRLLPETLVLQMQIIMVIVAIAVSAHILRLPTFREKQIQPKKKPLKGS
jgi:hypothetical protein